MGFLEQVAGALGYVAEQHPGVIVVGVQNLRKTYPTSPVEVAEARSANDARAKIEPQEVSLESGELV
jgi:hypothetical protein